MKCVFVQYLEALRRLRARPGGWSPLRTIHLTFVPDEEIGGADGMGAFLRTPDFEALQPIALALDEGLSNPREAFTAFYGERTPWWLLVRPEGPTGHGSRFIQDTGRGETHGRCEQGAGLPQGARGITRLGRTCWLQTQSKRRNWEM